MPLSPDQEQLLAPLVPDPKRTLARFMGNENLYLKFLKKFPDDPNMGRLAAALEADDWDGVESTAHALKGVTANLGLDPLCARYQALMDAVRKQAFADAPALLEAAQADYAQACAILARLA